MVRLSSFLVFFFVLVYTFSYTTHFRLALNSAVVEMSGDGNTMVSFDRRGSPANITVIKFIDSKYVSIKIQNFYGFVPILQNPFPSFATQRDDLYDKGFYNINRPRLNYDGSVLYFVSGQSYKIVKASLNNTNLINPYLITLT